jgi:glutamate synthase (NADPH/NADH) large chain
LGGTGRNFGAGMSGGVAYVLDEKNDFEAKVNREMVEISELSQEDKHIIRMYLEKHVGYTNSTKGKYVIDQLEALLSQFKKVLPVDYKNALSSRNLNISDVLADKNKVYTDIQIELK